MLYAQINRETNQIKSSPAKLPSRWCTPGGSTINHFNRLSIQSLQSFNWIPVVYEELLEGLTHNSQPLFDETNQRFIFEAVSKDIRILIIESERRIDEAASFASARYISQGVGQDCRYMIKREQAIRYLEDPMPIITDYPMIKREAEESGRTPKVLAQLISDIAEQWINLAAECEAQRCGGKKKCREAITVADVIRFRNIAIAALSEI